MWLMLELPIHANCSAYCLVKSDLLDYHSFAFPQRTLDCLFFFFKMFFLDCNGLCFGHQICNKINWTDLTVFRCIHFTFIHENNTKFSNNLLKTHKKMHSIFSSEFLFVCSNVSVCNLYWVCLLFQAFIPVVLYYGHQIQSLAIDCISGKWTLNKNSW